MEHSTYYFHMKMKIMVDFKICISVPLKDIKRPHIGLYSNFKKFFTIKGNSFQRKHETITTPFNLNNFHF